MSKKIPLYGLLAVLFVIGLLAWCYRPVQDILPTAAGKSDTASLQKQTVKGGAIQLPAEDAVSEIRVFKSKRYMEVMSGDKVIRRYAVRLGFSPEGHKTREGDGKTPEGRYLLDWRNPQSSFYKSFHISYPNAADKRQAVLNGVSPGGDIMIHGSFAKPEGLRRNFYHYLPSRDWTHGCIAVSNAVMDELWVLLDKNKPTPIEIVP